MNLSLVLISIHPTTKDRGLSFDTYRKTCSNCGWKNDSLKLSDRFWTCDACGILHDRDINASQNIVDFAFEGVYGEDTPNFKPVERKALVETNVNTKLFSLNQEVVFVRNYRIPRSSAVGVVKIAFRLYESAGVGDSF